MRDSTARDIAIAAQVAMGDTVQGVAETTGLTKGRVSQICNNTDNEMRLVIDSIRARSILELAQPAYDNIRNIILSTDKADNVLRLKYSSRILESIGVLPAYAPPPPIVANLYNVQVNVGIDQAVDNALRHLDSITSNDIIDLDPID
jgi:hypothetical protein